MPGPSPTTAAVESLRALSLITKALEAMVRADCLEIERRRAFIDDFECEADLVLGALLADSVSNRLKHCSFRAASAAARDCCSALLRAHRSCLGLPGHNDCQEALGRSLIRGAAKFLKWQGLAHGPAHAALWAWIDAALGMVRAASPDDAPELIHVLSTLTAAYDRIPLAAIPALDALLQRLTSQFSLSEDPVAGFFLAYRQGSRSAPIRPAALGAVSVDTRYFSVAAARDSVARCNAALLQGRSPAVLGFPDLEAGPLQEALSHLSRCWDPEKTRRRSHRHALDSELYLAHGLESIQLALSGGLPTALARCRLVDISKHGARVRTSSRRSARLDVGDLVAFRPGSLSALSDRREPSGKARPDLTGFEAHSGSMQQKTGRIWTASPTGAADQPQVRQAASDAVTWLVGQIRRVWHESEDEVSVGIEILALHAQHAQVDDGRHAHDVVVLGALERAQCARVIFAADWHSETDTVFLSVNGSVRKLSLESRVSLNDDATLGVCRVL